ncbi:MAG: hypothetical protein KDD53_11500, partial [Bdellovibrionales bacterium]|nr:hypothetical protein [Bdellovibrionales bacterium]
MKIFRLTTNYQPYVDSFYRKQPQLRNKSFSEQYSAFFEDCYGWAGHWEKPLARLGYELFEPISNALPLQTAWWRENETSALPSDPKMLRDTIIATQIRKYQPEILFIDDHVSFSKDFIMNLRNTIPSIKVVIGWCGAASGDSPPFQAYDLLLSNIPDLATEFSRLGYKAKVMRHAFSTRILERLPATSAKAIPFSFVGSLIKGRDF